MVVTTQFHNFTERRMTKSKKQNKCGARTLFQDFHSRGPVKSISKKQNKTNVAYRVQHVLFARFCEKQKKTQKKKNYPSPFEVC